MTESILLITASNTRVKLAKHLQCAPWRGLTSGGDPGAESKASGWSEKGLPEGVSL